MSDPRQLVQAVRFAGDLCPEGLLHAVTVRSPLPRARLNAVRLPPRPEGYHGLDAGGIPGANRLSFGGQSMPFLAAETTHYAGEPVALA